MISRSRLLTPHLLLAVALAVAAPSPVLAGGAKRSRVATSQGRRRAQSRGKRSGEQKRRSIGLRARAAKAFFGLSEKVLDKGAAAMARLRKPRPMLYARHALVAFDPGGDYVQSNGSGAFVKNKSLEGIPGAGGAAIFHAPALEGVDVSHSIGGGRASRSGSTGADGFVETKLDKQEMRRAIRGLDPRRGGLIRVEVKAGGKSATERVLALPRDYKGPIFISDVNLTLRDTTTLGAAMGKDYKPIPGTDTLLNEVARRNVPIIYMSGGFEAEGPWNETFLRQFPEGPIFIRPQANMTEIADINEANANMGNYKSHMLAEIRKLFPQAQLIALGDDKHQDAYAYHQAGIGRDVFIRHSHGEEINVPEGFEGTVATDGRIDRAFRQKVLKAVDDAIARTPSP